MPVYVIGHVKIIDEEKYRSYEQKMPAILNYYGARLLAADRSPRVLEGNFLFDETVIIEFYDTDHAKRTLTDPSYISILQDRIEGAQVVAILVESL